MYTVRPRKSQRPQRQLEESAFVFYYMREKMDGFGRFDINYLISDRAYEHVVLVSESQRANTILPTLLPELGFPKSLLLEIL